MIIADSRNQKWIVKFKYIPVEKQREIRFFKCPATITWTEMTTVCAIRKVEQPISANVYSEVLCKKSELFKKYVGREITFTRLLSSMNFDEKDIELFYKAYNEKFHHKISLPTNVNEE